MFRLQSEKKRILTLSENYDVFIKKCVDVTKSLMENSAVKGNYFTYWKWKVLEQ